MFDIIFHKQNYKIALLHAMRVSESDVNAHLD